MIQRMGYMDYNDFTWSIDIDIYYSISTKRRTKRRSRKWSIDTKKFGKKILEEIFSIINKAVKGDPVNSALVCN